MPLLAPAPPPQDASHYSIWESREMPFAQGLEGQQVREQIEFVSRHWREQSLGALGEPATDLLDELRDYKHPPFERVGSLGVRFTRINDLKPRKIIFDEDEL